MVEMNFIYFVCKIKAHSNHLETCSFPSLINYWEWMWFLASGLEVVVASLVAAHGVGFCSVGCDWTPGVDWFLA